MADSSGVDKRELLRQSLLFAEFAPPELDKLAQFAKLRLFEPKEVIFNQGEPGRHMFIVASGTVRISILSEEGREMILGTFGPGDVFGEIALFDGKARTATVTAISACECLVLERQEFLAFLEQQPRAAIKLLAALAGRLRRTNEIIEDTLFLNLPSRLAKKLLYLAEIHGRQTPRGLLIKVKLSQQELGNLVATSRESVNKQLRAWQAQGLLQIQQGYITVIDPKKLAGWI
ncbi:MAG: Crp/Fnr family transcriptional regulator [Candidatus Competibacteraceae bacterium]